jgi:hypothetical protein
MDHALARQRRWGAWWLVFAIAALGLMAQAATAQVTKGQASEPKKAAQKEATKGAAPAQGKDQAESAPPPSGEAPPPPSSPPPEGAVVDPRTIKKEMAIEMFVDPRAEQLLDPKQFKEYKPTAAARRLPPDAENALTNMATGTTQPNRELIQAWVETQAAELTSHKNLEALLSDSPDPPKPAADNTKQEKARYNQELARWNQALEASQAVGEAARKLIQPLEQPATNANAAFRRYYSEALLRVLPKNLLENQLHARTVAMIALGKAGLPQAVKSVYTNQLRDADQVLMVKLWAARGITNAVQGGRAENAISTKDAIEAAQALSDFLNNEKDAHWSIQFRALEALGALRQATADPIQGQAEMANTALRFVADPKAKADVRAWGAWALGMMRVPQQLARYNFALVAHVIGEAAADIGEQVGATRTDSPDLSMHLTDLLLSKIVPSFIGVEGVRDSGLLKNPNLGNSKSFVQGVSDRVQDVAVAAYNVAGPTVSKRQAERNKDELNAKVKDLRSFLAKNAPSDRHLVPGGPELPSGGGTEVAAKNGQ